MAPKKGNQWWLKRSKHGRGQSLTSANTSQSPVNDQHYQKQMTEINPIKY